MPGSSSSSSSSAASRGIVLNRTSQVQYDDGTAVGFRLQISATDGYLMPNEIFRYVRTTTAGNDITPPTDVDTFEGVCSTVELEDLPPDEPNSGSNLRFRANEVDLVLVSRIQAEQVWEDIRTRVVNLKEALDALDVMGEPEQYTIGNPPV